MIGYPPNGGETMYRKFLKNFAAVSVILLILAAGLVVLFDPFFHYHEPVGPLKAVLTKKEYQSIGTIRNFSYDSLIMGSSTAENFNNRWFDDAFGVTAVKAIKSSGVTAQLDYYMEQAFESRKIKMVFYSLDLFALGGDPDIVFPDESMPLYLYDRNPFTDVNYVLNKDVIFEDIPYMLAETFLDDYDEGTSYNWAQYKTFSKEEALSHYDRPEEIAPMKAEEEYKEFVDGNVELLVKRVEQHPDTMFYFFYPPYSMLWWDNMYRSGELEQVMYAAGTSAERLLGYENVRMYYFQNDRDIILDLDQYMDPVHFTAEINQYMVEQMKEDNYRLTEENYREELDKMRKLAEEIREKEIRKYFP